MALLTNTIPLATAQEWAATWRADPSNTVKAFLIPQVDIKELLAEDNVQDVRAYVGIDSNGDCKLMLVGVDINGHDLIDEASGDCVYDFTEPCPKTCDFTSPMYTLIPQNPEQQQQ